MPENAPSVSSRPSPGEPAPWITLPTRDQPQFHLHTVAGRYLLLLFLGDGGCAEAGAALIALAGLGAWINQDSRAAFTVCSRPLTASESQLVGTGVIQLRDADLAAHRAYAVDQAPVWVLLDPTLRVLARAEGPQPPALLGMLEQLPAPALHAGCATPAPILIVPRLFEPELCAALIRRYEAKGGFPSGFMREVDGRTRLINDPAHKMRQDCEIEDAGLRLAIQARVKARLVPEIRKAFQFDVTRMERYIVARYDTDYGGHFRPHRDNTTKGTAHRRFAASINLNAEDYDGGDLRFAEYGAQTYRPPTGGAAIFSCSILHECTPVTRGVRYVFLPFLYDEAAAAIRERNAGFIDFAAASAA
jgi:2OG-Fe(II) oxygenase superfamily